MFNPSLLDNPLYQTAFTHRSYLNENPDVQNSNERLEFLGDAVLNFLISRYLYQQRPNDTEGNLTNMRSYLVKTSSLAQAARRINLGEYMRLSKGEELSGGRNNPQLLANVYEALLGAIYLDQGLEAAEQFVQDTLLTLFTKELKEGPPKDAKSLLQEKLQEQFKKSPHYEILESSGPDHAKQFRVGVFLDEEKLGEGVGSSKQIAEEKAAEAALERLSANS